MIGVCTDVTNVMSANKQTDNVPRKLDAMSVPDLRAELKRLGHENQGLRHVLVARLENAMSMSMAIGNTATAKTQSKGGVRVHCKLGSGSWESCLQLCLEEVRFRQVSSKGKYDLLFLNSWKGNELEISRLAPSQFLNRFPGLAELAHKAALADAIEKVQQLNPTHSSYSPRTWVLPRDMELLRKQIEAGHTYILKPDDGNQGDGICIVQEMVQVEEVMREAQEAIEKMNSKSASSVKSKRRLVSKTLGKSKTEMQDNGVWVLQEYIPRPLLLDGLKFDFRLYVMIAGVNPLRVYLCKQGMARFCTEAYQAPTAENIENTYMHLTNFAINKHHDDFTYASANGGSTEIGPSQSENGSVVGSDSSTAAQHSTEETTAEVGEGSAVEGAVIEAAADFGNDGSKRLLGAVLRALREEGRDVDAVWRGIQEVVVSTCNAMQPTLLAEYDKWHTSTCARHEKKEAMKKRCKTGFGGGGGFGFGGGEVMVVGGAKTDAADATDATVTDRTNPGLVAADAQQQGTDEQQAKHPPASPFRGSLHPTETPSPSAEGALEGTTAAVADAAVAEAAVADAAVTEAATVRSGAEGVDANIVGAGLVNEKTKDLKKGVLYSDPPSRCFHIVGFDILLDEDLKPWLLEVNHSPSFNIDADGGEVSEIDVKIKKSVLSDALRTAFVGFDPESSCYEQLLPPPSMPGA
jgi:glutathione synthase/RimK-type ligase-like ATP-grasp enzyme